MSRSSLPWILRGLLAKPPTTSYPDGEAPSGFGISPGLPRIALSTGRVTDCPTGAIGEEPKGADHCVHCHRCDRGDGAWDPGFEWARRLADKPPLPASFSRSLHILAVDAGACTACMKEIALIGKPHYNMHRLGFFVTPTPRKADILLVAGPGSDAMRRPLREAYESMPEPRRVVAVGACALNGGVFGPSFVSDAGIAGTIPVDIELPGCPPPPLAILHALLVATGRKEGS